MQTGEKEQIRNISLDIARTIGTLLIILAHVGAPKIINEIRCFDVVLLVFVSGYCIRMSNYGLYLWKRIKRLVFPAWVLLILLFCSTWAACIIVKKEQIYTIGKILKSFTFLNGGIGFIWIVRIYLGIALVAPIIIRVNRLIKNDIMVIAVAMLFIIVLSFIVKWSTPPDNSPLYYILEILAYALVAFLGYRCRQKTERNTKLRKNFLLILISLCLVSTFISIIIHGFNPNEYKYPPQALYLFYGVLISGSIFLLLNHVIVSRENRLHKLITWFSTSSFDVYLAHIFVLSIINMLEGLIGIELLWLLKYILVLGISLMIVVSLELIGKIISSRRKAN